MTKSKQTLSDGVFTAVTLIVIFSITLLLQRYFSAQALTPTLFVLGVFLVSRQTHGYFWGNDDATFGRLRFSDHPLNRCGLLLSGADNKWFGDELPRGVDDGFLTALEISALDFRGMDLIVLSACETGRGDVEGDGVFGLQRGFKMASANSILMSLWKVDDNATCRLMIDFYRNWIVEGMTKHDALERAKQTLRSYKDNGWDNPYYWASFILLDGIE